MGLLFFLSSKVDGWVMEVDLVLLVILFLIGFVGSFLSGMVGIGGSIIKYPMLLYIPPLFGLAAFSAHEVSGVSAVQVLFATVGGVWAYRKGGYLHKMLILYMGTSILLGSLLGSFGSTLMEENAINVVYALLATLAAIMIFLPNKGEQDVRLDKFAFNKWIAAASAFFVGVGAGIVGAAGAFVLVPIMLVVLKIPMRMTIATSLAITLISSIGSTFGKLVTGQVLLVPALIMVIASLLGSSLGANLAKKVHTKWLQWILALLIAATAVKLWVDMI